MVGALPEMVQTTNNRVKGFDSISLQSSVNYVLLCNDLRRPIFCPIFIKPEGQCGHGHSLTTYWTTLIMTFLSIIIIRLLTSRDGHIEGFYKSFIFAGM